MKKYITILLTSIATVVSSVNSFAYTKHFEEYYRSDVGVIGNSDNMTWEDLNRVGWTNLFPYIETTDYIMRNGTAMVKFRDMVTFIGGKVDYNTNTKIVKVYFNTDLSNGAIGLTVNSVAVRANRNRIDYTYVSGDSVSYNTKVTPVIINGSLYVSAVDLGNVLGGEGAKMQNGKVYINYRYNAG